MIGVVFSTGMGPGQLEVIPDLNHSWLQFRSRIGFLYTRCCMVLLLPWKLQLILNPYQAFQTLSRQLSADVFSEEIIHNVPILMKLYHPVLGVRIFLKHSVYTVVLHICDNIM